MQTATTLGYRGSRHTSTQKCSGLGSTPQRAAQQCVGCCFQLGSPHTQPRHTGARHAATPARARHWLKTSRRAARHTVALAKTSFLPSKDSAPRQPRMASRQTGSTSGGCPKHVHTSAATHSVASRRGKRPIEALLRRRAATTQTHHHPSPARWGPGNAHHTNCTLCMRKLSVKIACQEQTADHQLSTGQQT